jgi:hypothetical protein
MRIWLVTMAGLLGGPLPCVAQVPATAPDSVPVWFGHDSSWTQGRRCSGILKHVLGVYFYVGTSRRARQEAVDLVQGVVVGGIRLSDGDGAYYLRLPAGETMTQLDSISAVLMRLPQVESAFPNLCASLGDRHPTRDMGSPGVPPNKRMQPTAPQVKGT